MTVILKKKNHRDGLVVHPPCVHVPIVPTSSNPGAFKEHQYPESRATPLIKEFSDTYITPRMFVLIAVISWSHILLSRLQDSIK